MSKSSTIDTLYEYLPWVWLNLNYKLNNDHNFCAVCNIWSFMPTERPLEVSLNSFMCGALKCAWRDSMSVHFSTHMTVFALTTPPVTGVSRSSVGPYSMQPCSARTWGTKFQKAAKYSSRLPSAVSIVAITWMYYLCSISFIYILL